MSFGTKSNIGKDIIRMLGHLTKIYEKDVNENSFYLLEKVKIKCEWLWKIYFRLMLVPVVGTLNMSATSISLIWMMTGTFNADYFYHPHKVILPWNQHTLLGYAGELVFDLIAGVGYLITNGSLLVLFISICWHHNAFCKMFQIKLWKLSEDEDKSKKFILREIIQFSISTKNWFLETKEVFSFYLVLPLVCNMITLASVVFQLRLESEQMDSNMFILIINLFNGVLNLFLLCYFGKTATDSYSSLAAILYECNFQTLPVELQKYFILMISDVQRPLSYDGYGLITLNLETFTKLLKMIYTYYMMFETMGE